VPQGPLALYPASPGGFGAEVEAKLISENGCLYLRSNTQKWLALWPSPGTTWDGTNVRLHDSVVAIGTTTVFGGGETQLTQTSARRTDWVKAPEARCFTGRAWWIASVDPDS
jgi:hypothetical protein